MTDAEILGRPPAMRPVPPRNREDRAPLRTQETPKGRSQVLVPIYSTYSAGGKNLMPVSVPKAPWEG